MTLKKLMLLLGAAMALAAFAAPAAQANPEWYTTTAGGDVTIGKTTATGHTVEFTGELVSTAVGGNVVGGPCVVHAHGTIWNDPTIGATGEVDSLTITFPCAAKSFGVNCEIEEAFSSFEEGSWPITSSTAGADISVEGANFSNVYKGCPVIPNGVAIEASGTATGEFNNANSCIEFNNSGDLEGASGAVTLHGALCETGGAITLK